MKLVTKKIMVLLLCFLLVWFCGIPAGAKKISQETVGRPTVTCKSAVLMEAKTGNILFELNPNEALPPASVTKVMTLLLVMEAIEAGKIHYTDMVSASAHACSMGGSQIYLEEGEQMSVDDLIKSVVIASANDAAVALAEYICGTEDAFVEQMNLKAKALGMTSTNFENTNGLDDTATNHVTSAMDIAIMSRELIQHKKIIEYSSIWMDTIRNGEFGLTNTNRLVRFYKGATGLKTGSTAKAGFCISATAERDEMGLICVIMGAETRDIRNATATALLDWGFANYTRYEPKEIFRTSLAVRGGERTQCEVFAEPFSLIVEKNQRSKIQTKIELPKALEAPVEKGQIVGRIIYSVGEKELGSANILTEESVDSIGFWGVFFSIVKSMSIY